MSASELADWWDQQKRESDAILTEWVQENPQWWAIGVAALTATAMDLGAGMVDALRLGEGVAEGGPSGIATDAMRLLVLAGPVARGGAALGRFAHARAIRLAVTTKGVTGPCTFTAVNNAVAITRFTSKNLFVTARDAAAALGKPLAGLATAGSKYKLAAWIDDVIPFLVKQGVRLRNLGTPKTLQDIAAAARAHDGVVIFAVEWIDMAGKLQRHSLIAVRTLKGVRYADYGGKFMTSVSDLASRGGVFAAKNGYSIASTTTKGTALLIKGMEEIGSLERHAMEVFRGALLLLEGMHAIETPDGVDLAFPVVPAAAIEKATHEPEVIKQSFAAFKARKAGHPLLRVPAVKIHGRPNGPPRSDYLTGVQYRLNALGFAAGPVDGINGPRTIRAVREFQRTYDLAVDAIPGPITQAKLVELCGY